jgi:hypothetical protein
MQISGVAVFLFAVLAIIILVYIFTFVRRKNRGDLENLESELKRDKPKQS